MYFDHLLDPKKKLFNFFFNFLILNFKNMKKKNMNVIDLMEENCFMASVDLKDAYFSVSIHGAH